MPASFEQLYLFPQQCQLGQTLVVALLVVIPIDHGDGGRLLEEWVQMPHRRRRLLRLAFLGLLLLLTMNLQGPFGRNVGLVGIDSARTSDL